MSNWSTKILKWRCDITILWRITYMYTKKGLTTRYNHKFCIKCIEYIHVWPKKCSVDELSMTTFSYGISECIQEKNFIFVGNNRWLRFEYFHVINQFPVQTVYFLILKIRIAIQAHYRHNWWIDLFSEDFLKGYSISDLYAIETQIQ